MARHFHHTAPPPDFQWFACCAPSVLRSTTYSGERNRGTFNSSKTAAVSCTGYRCSARGDPRHRSATGDPRHLARAYLGCMREGFAYTAGRSLDSFCGFIWPVVAAGARKASMFSSDHGCTFRTRYPSHPRHVLRVVICALALGQPYPLCDGIRGP